MHLNLDTSFLKNRIEHWLDGLGMVNYCIEVEHYDMKVDWNTD